jgi:hypothetical protein
MKRDPSDRGSRVAVWISIGVQYLIHTTLLEQQSSISCLTIHISLKTEAALQQQQQQDIQEPLQNNNNHAPPALTQACGCSRSPFNRLDVTICCGSNQRWRWS